MLMVVIRCHQEIWKPLTFNRPVDTTKYLISNYGHIKNSVTGHLYVSSTCVDGYDRITLTTGITPNDKKTFTVHRLVAWNFVEGYDETHCIVNHKNSIRNDNYADNLEWVTSSQNTLHGITSGFISHKRGELSPSASYSEDFVRQICVMLENEIKPSDILKLVDLHSDSKKRISDLIHRIKSKSDWASISDEYDIPEISYKREYSTDVVHDICRKLEDGLYPREIISMCELSDPNDIKSFRKLINDVRQRKTHGDITSQYKFNNKKLSKAKYDTDLIENICKYLSTSMSPMEIVTKLNLHHDKTKYRDLIYDIKRRRTWTSISSNYEW